MLMPITQLSSASSKPPSENRRGHQSATRAEPESAWATKDNVVGRRVWFAVDRIVEDRRLQHPAGFEGESLPGRKISLEAGCDRWGAGAGAHRALSSSTGRAECPLATSIASLRSASMSRRSSIPTDNRTSSGVTPVSFCSSTVSWE